MQTLGPVSGIPHDLLRPDVLLLVGEDPAECAAAAGVTWQHSYRGFHAAVRDDRLVVVSPFGSTVMEALLWELLAPGVVTRVILAGTAGALGGYSGPHMAPVQVTEATSVYQSFDAPPAPYVPSWHLDLPEVASISTDRFYGFSPMTDDAFPAEPGLCEAWSKWGNADAIVEMEVAAFFHFAQRLAPALQYAAVKVVANDVSALESLPDGSARAMQRAVDAAWAAF